MRHPATFISETTGAPESNLLLLTTILLSYPVGAGFRYLYANNNKTNARSPQDDANSQHEDDDNNTKKAFAKTINARNRYMAITGLVLSAYFSGWDMYHGVVTMTISYVLCYIFQQHRQLAVAAVWIFNAIYLLRGYYTVASSNYDISWTMPQCILCLRLMGFSMDFMDGATVKSTVTTTVTEQEIQASVTATSEDGNKPKNRVSTPPSTISSTTTTTATTTTTTTTTTSGMIDSSSTSSARPLSFGYNTALTELPSFSQMVGYCYYPSAFLVGPQFSFSLYQEWLFFFDTQQESTTAATSSTRTRQQYKYVLTCFGWGLGYLTLHQLIGTHFPTSYLLTPEYASLWIPFRFVIFWFTGNFVLTKYLCIWLFNEGATALFGIGYEGQTSTGEHSFKGLANVDPIKYETATSLEHIIGSFNINTNMWSKYYVFKRLRWMGSKSASQIGTLAFLAIWHGFHYGYFSTFLLEFLNMMAEGIVQKWVAFVMGFVVEYVNIYLGDGGDSSSDGTGSKEGSGSGDSDISIGGRIGDRIGGRVGSRIGVLIDDILRLGLLSKWIGYALDALDWFLCKTALFYASVGFDLLSISSSFIAYRQVYFFGHLGLISLLISSFFLPSSWDKSGFKLPQKLVKLVKAD